LELDEAFNEGAAACSILNTLLERHLGLKEWLFSTVEQLDRVVGRGITSIWWFIFLW